MNAASNMKFCSNKSNAKRALNSIGLAALQAADKLLVEAEDGRWGFNMDAAEKIQNDKDNGKDPLVKSPSKQAPSLAPSQPRVLTVRGGKKVFPSISEPAKKDLGATQAEGKQIRADRTRPNPSKGYTIDKDRPQQNGVKRPSVGTVCGSVWAAFDAIVAGGLQVTSKDLPPLAESNNWNLNNVSCEYYQWRKFNGITGRSSK